MGWMQSMIEPHALNPHHHRKIYRTQQVSEGRARPDRRSPRIFRAYRVIDTIIMVDSYPTFSLGDHFHGLQQDSRFFS